MEKAFPNEKRGPTVPAQGPQKEQEKLSLRQIESAFPTWNVGRYEDDNGEDRVIQVMNEGGIPAGVSFHLQAKSTTKLKHPILNEGVSYKLEVEHLLRWEGHNTPVIVLLWDVGEKTGYWQDAPSILEELDKKNEGWRDQTYVNVRLYEPFDQQRIRETVVHICLPVIRSNRPLEMRLAFLNNPEAHALSQKLRTLIDEGGESLELPAEFISVKYSNWYERAMGQAPSGNLVLTPKKLEQSFQLQLFAKGAEPIPMEMAWLKGGRVKQWYDNSKQRCLIRLGMAIDSEAEGIEFHIGFRLFGLGISESLAVVGFLLAVKRGRPVGLVHAVAGSIGVQVRQESRDIPEEAVLVELQEVLRKAKKVQDEYREFGEFVLDRGPNAREVEAIEELYKSIGASEWEEKVPELTFKIGPGFTSDRPEFTNDSPFSIAGSRKYTLFGVVIVQGRVDMKYPDKEAWRQAMLAGMNTAKRVVRIPPSTVTCRIVEPPTEEEIQAARKETARLQAKKPSKPNPAQREAARKPRQLGKGRKKPQPKGSAAKRKTRRR